MRWAVLVLALCAATCASSQGDGYTVEAVPARLNPLEGAIVIELGVPNWQEICFRIAPEKLQSYRCVTVGDLRMVIEDKRNANWKAFLASWGQTWAVKAR